MKNGVIEFFRFYFALMVLLHHCVKHFIGGNAHYFYGGYFAVSFFFILSGYLMANSVWKQTLGKDLAEIKKISFSEQAESTFNFIKRKIVTIFPTHVIAWTLALVVALAVNWHGISFCKKFILQAIPSFFFISKLIGFKVPVILGVEWYLISMFIAMAILYPLLRYSWVGFVKYIAPIGSVLLLGYIFHKSGNGFSGFGEVLTWDGFIPKGVLRALADIMLGVVVFELSRYKIPEAYKKYITLLGIVSLVCLNYIMIRNLGDRYAATGLMFSCLLVYCAFGGYFNIGSLFDKKCFGYLGALSLPLFLIHQPVISVVKKISEASNFANCLFVLFISLLLSIVILRFTGSSNFSKAK